MKLHRSKVFLHGLGGAHRPLHRSKVFLQGLAGAHQPLLHHVIQPPKSFYEALPSQSVPSRIKCFNQPHLHFARCATLCDAVNILEPPSGDALYLQATVLKTVWLQ